MKAVLRYAFGTNASVVNSQRLLSSEAIDRAVAKSVEAVSDVSSMDRSEAAMVSFEKKLRASSKAMDEAALTVEEAIRQISRTK